MSIILDQLSFSMGKLKVSYSGVTLGEGPNGNPRAILAIAPSNIKELLSVGTQHNNLFPHAFLEGDETEAQNNYLYTNKSVAFISCELTAPLEANKSVPIKIRLIEVMNAYANGVPASFSAVEAISKLLDLATHADIVMPTLATYHSGGRSVAIAPMCIPPIKPQLTTCVTKLAIAALQTQDKSNQPSYVKFAENRTHKRGRK